MAERGATIPKEGDGKRVDFYELLGVSRTATEKEIASAYKKLALKYHPDRTRGDPEAAEKFKEISTANQVLMDPNKRRQYDLSGGDLALLTANGEFESVDVSQLGGMGRVLGAMIGKLGIPLATMIAQDTLTKAYEICRHSGLDEQNPLLLPVRDGVEYKGSVERQQSVFFLLTVPDKGAEQGVALRCISLNKSRFKVVVFDQAGAVRYQDESVKSFDGATTKCSLFFTPYEVSTLGDSVPSPMEESVPPSLTRLDTFQMLRRELEPGKHLVCVYGDNFIRAAQFSFMAVPLSRHTSQQVQTVQKTDSQMLEQRQQLKDFQSVFVKAKTEWEATLKKLEEHDKQTEELVANREQAYESLIGTSLMGLQPPGQPPTSDRGVPPVQSVSIDSLRRQRTGGPEPGVWNSLSGMFSSSSSSKSKRPTV